MSEESNNDKLRLITSISYQERLDTANIESFAPNAVGHYERKSDPTTDYNCLAWAVENNQKWFNPERFCAGYYWPKGVERHWSMKTVIHVLSEYGFDEEVELATFEDGIVKVAIYADVDEYPTHFARQLANGKWTSKAGELIDFEHDSLECLHCDDYGKVTKIVQKKVA
jgi:hypothetical protein